MDTRTFLKEQVAVFKDVSADRIKELVDGSVLRSFEPNEAIAHQGAEAVDGTLLNSRKKFSVVCRAISASETPRAWAPHRPPEVPA